MNKTVHRNAIINERICKQLIASFMRQTRGGGIKTGVALHELIHVVYAQGHQAGMQSIYKEVFDE